MVVATAPHGRPQRRGSSRKSAPTGSKSTGELVIHWILLAASGGAIAAAFSGLFGAVQNVRIILSICVAVLLPATRWLYDKSHKSTP
jgi:hypothetical protein